MTVSAKLWAADIEDPSVSLTVNVEVPATAGVPVITPAGDNDSPCGSEPDAIAQV